jgi:Ca2+-binding EF-hand superfamily protein
MLGTIQKTNLNRVFDTLDVTGDGYLDASDFQTLAQRMRTLRADMDQQTQKDIDKAFTDWWKTFRDASDTDKDGQITRDEFIGAVDRGLQNDPEFIERMVHVSKITFRAADVEGNGRLTPEQVERLYHAFGVNTEYSADTFQRIDSNGDGTVTVEEYVQAAREVYLSNDPTAPGTVMFGPTA